jgi:type II secretory ATPase GspE/PulE/Tfp pilus assembly ATPase PilB-like protein
MLEALNTPSRNIITVEDPIEYELPGVTQVPVKQGIGYTFERVLRSCLRQDPNVLLVGEIRDNETGDIAMKAAMTGHLVLSTLHTNDALGAVARLVNMGIEPYLVASCVLLVGSQRLPRRVCPRCAKPVQPPKELIESSPKLDNGSFDEEALAEHYGLGAASTAPGTEGYGRTWPTDPARSAEVEGVREAEEALRYAAGNFYVNDKPTGAIVGQQPAAREPRGRTTRLARCRT